MVKFLDIKLILKTILILFFIIFVSYKMQSQINSNPENEFSLINMPDSLQKIKHGWIYNGYLQMKIILLEIEWS